MAVRAHQRGTRQKHPRRQRNNAPLQRLALSRADQRAGQIHSRFQAEGCEEIGWRLSRKENGEWMGLWLIRSPFCFHNVSGAASGTVQIYFLSDLSIA